MTIDQWVEMCVQRHHDMVLDLQHTFGKAVAEKVGTLTDVQRDMIKASAEAFVMGFVKEIATACNEADDDGVGVDNERTRHLN